MITSQGSLVVVGANTADCQVFWNGQIVPNLGISIDHNAGGGIGRVVLKIAEDPMLADMQAAGIIIRRMAL